MGYVIDTDVEDASYHGYDDLGDILTDLESRYEDSVSVTTVGETVEKRPIYGLELHTRGRPVEGYIFITAGGHGDEPAGPEAALKLVERLCGTDNEKARYLLDRYEIDIIPAINTDMYARPVAEREHHNVENRDPPYYPFRRDARDVSVEGVEVRDFIDTKAMHAPVILTLDYHETTDFKGFLVVRKDKEEVLGDKVNARFKAEGIPRHADDYYTFYGHVHDGIQDCRPAYRDSYSSTLIAEGERLGSPHGLIFETPKKFPLEKRIEMDLVATDEALAAVASPDYPDV